MKPGYFKTSEYQKTIDDWHSTMLDTYNNWKERYPFWEMKTL